MRQTLKSNGRDRSFSSYLQWGSRQYYKSGTYFYLLKCYVQSLPENFQVYISNFMLLWQGRVTFFYFCNYILELFVKWSIFFLFFLVIYCTSLKPNEGVIPLSVHGLWCDDHRVWNPTYSISAITSLLTRPQAMFSEVFLLALAGVVIGTGVMWLGMWKQRAQSVGYTCSILCINYMAFFLLLLLNKFCTLDKQKVSSKRDLGAHHKGTQTTPPLLPT